MHFIKSIFPHAVIAMIVMFVINALFLPAHHLLMNKPGTVAFAQLGVLVLITLHMGTLPAIAATIAGAIVWEFAYLHPYFTLKLIPLQPEEGILLAAYLLVSVAIGYLVTLTRHRAIQAEANRKEMQQLFRDLQHEQEKRADQEEALQKHEAQLRRLSDTNVIGLMFCRIDGAVTEANEAFLRIVQYAREDLNAGKINWRAMTPPECRQSDELAIEELRQAGACAPFEKEFIRQDGSRAPVLVGAALAEDSPEQGVAFVLDLSERKHAQNELRRRADEFAALYDASQELATQQNMSTLLMVILDRAKSLLHGTVGAVMTFDPSSNLLELAAVDGADIPPGTHIALGEGVTETVARTRQPLYINNYRHSPLHAQRFTHLTIESILAVPMLSGGELIGVLSVMSCGTPREFTDADVHLLSLFAAQVAVAMRNARLLDEMRKRTEELACSEARARRLVDSNIIGIFFWDMDGTISSSNDAFLQMIGYDRAESEANNLSWGALTPDEYRMRDQQAIAELRECGRFIPYEKEYICKDGRRLPVLIGGALLEGSQQQGVAFVLDLTERRGAEGRVRYLAQHDVLTGLPNRLVFQDRLELAIAQARREKAHIAVLFIDLDYFKHINDSLGHQTGDMLLLDVAQRLQHCLREGDNVARLGGDEFIISLAPVDPAGEEAAAVARKVLEAFGRPATVEGHELYVTASIGISMYPSDGIDTEALLRAADTAMYHAKEKGKNNYQFFTVALNEATTRRLTIANQLHRALERGEFVLHYQPQIDMRSGRIIEAEALLRWRRADGSLEQPEDFVKVAEETGQIVQIGEWALLQACTRLKQWQVAGHSGLRIAVNISPAQLRHATFASTLRRILQVTDVVASDVVLEITEGILMAQNDESLSALSRITETGVRLAVDDFGVGYSNLAYLQRFPIHTLKIDQSFVRDIVDDPRDNALVVAIIAMARSLHLEIVAEGVETNEQAIILQQHGCQVAQGYYYCRPVPEKRFEQMLFKQNGDIPSGWA